MEIIHVALSATSPFGTHLCGAAGVSGSRNHLSREISVEDLADIRVSDELDKSDQTSIVRVCLMFPLRCETTCERTASQLFKTDEQSSSSVRLALLSCGSQAFMTLFHDPSVFSLPVVDNRDATSRSVTRLLEQFFQMCFVTSHAFDI